MSGLAVPQQQQTSGKTISRSGSASSLRPQIEHEDDLAPVTRSRRNSESNAGAGATPTSAPSAGAPGSAAAKAGLIPLPQGPIQQAAENESLTSSVDWAESDHLKATDPNNAFTSVYVGKNKKPFHVHTSALVEKSPYFKRTLGSDPTKATVEQTSFEDIDEFAMALFLHWLQAQGQLHGPHDFHSLAHYLSLYVLAKKFEIEGLENQVMDLVRHYYAHQNMTAPAYRLEYIYHYTQGPNHMRHFLVSTAAFRCLEEAPHPDLAVANPMLHKTFYAPGSNVSDSIKAVLAKNPETAIDFIEELVRLKRTEHDPRHGPDCDWHVHATAKCKAERREPWQTDGAATSIPVVPGAEGVPVQRQYEMAKLAQIQQKIRELQLQEAAQKVLIARHRPDCKPSWFNGMCRCNVKQTESQIDGPADEPPKPAASKPADPAKSGDPPKHANEPPKPAESDDGPFKRFGGKMRGHFDKLHKKDAPAASKLEAPKPEAPKPAAPKLEPPKPDKPAEKPEAPKSDKPADKPAAPPAPTK